MMYLTSRPMLFHDIYICTPGILKPLLKWLNSDQVNPEDISGDFQK